jgi:hypothetical protein
MCDDDRNLFSSRAFWLLLIVCACLWGVVIWAAWTA